MTGATSGIFYVHDNHPEYVRLTILSNTGAVFQEKFLFEKTIFAHVKYLAMHALIKDNDTNLLNSTSYIAFNELDNYQLISIDTRKVVDERKTLSEEDVTDEDKYLLTKKLPQYTLTTIKTLNICSIDSIVIDVRTKDLPVPRNSFSDLRKVTTNRKEFSQDFSRVLLTLLEISQKLLWYHPDAEYIFQQVEEILSESGKQELNSTEINQNHINNRVNQTRMDFIQPQVQPALEQMRYDLDAALNLVLIQTNTGDNQEEEIQLNKVSSFYSKTSPFLSFRQLRKQFFRPDPSVIRSLEEIGFNYDDIVNALRICLNDRNLSYQYLIADEQQQQHIIDVNDERTLDRDSSMFQAIIENSIVQRALNNPKIFLILIRLYENPGSITIYLNDLEIGAALLQINSIYHSERYSTNVY